MCWIPSKMERITVSSSYPTYSNESSVRMIFSNLGIFFSCNLTYANISHIQTTILSNATHLRHFNSIIGKLSGRIQPYTTSRNGLSVSFFR